MNTALSLVSARTGNISSNWEVKAEVHKADLGTAPPAAPPSHHIMVLDRSGSMFYDMDPLKKLVTGLLAVGEYHNPELVISVISYSSQGDVTVHVSRKAVADVNPQDLQQIRAGGLTCISGALRAAIPLVREGEVTVLSLHSDGYANHPSALSERRDMEGLARELRSLGATLHSIAYSAYADYATLSSVSREGGGECVPVRGMAEVYDALRGHLSPLAGATQPVFQVGPFPEGTLAVVVRGSEILTPSCEGVKLRGVKDGEEIRIYTFTPSKEAPVPQKPTAETRYLCALLARRALNDGNMSLCKDALVSTGSQALVKSHLKAVTASDRALLASDLSQAVLLGPEDQPFYQYDPSLSLPNFLQLLYTHRDSVEVDFKAMREQYTPVTVPRFQGTREADGTLTPFPYREVPNLPEDEGTGQWTTISGINFSRTQATISLDFAFPASIEEVATGKVITEVAGVDLTSRRMFRSFLLVSQGDSYLSSLRIKISDPELIKTFQKAIPALAFDGKGVCTVPLSEMVLFMDSGTKPVTQDDLARNFVLALAVKALSACLGTTGGGTGYDSDQIEALRAVGLTPGLSFSPPTINTYTDLAEELSSGRIESVPTFNVTLGTEEVLSAASFRSANEFLARYYTVTVGGKQLAKPKMPDVLTPGAIVEPAKLSARSKVTTADKIQLKLMNALLGIDKAPGVQPLGKTLKEYTLEELRDLKATLADNEEQSFVETIGALAMEVSTTGTVPARLDAEEVTLEVLQKRCPLLDLPKSASDCVFYHSPKNGTVLMIKEGSRYIPGRSNA